MMTTSITIKTPVRTLNKAELVELLVADNIFATKKEAYKLPAAELRGIVEGIIAEGVRKEKEAKAKAEEERVAKAKLAHETDWLYIGILRELKVGVENLIEEQMRTIERAKEEVTKDFSGATMRNNLEKVFQAEQRARVLHPLLRFISNNMNNKKYTRQEFLDTLTDTITYHMAELMNRTDYNGGWSCPIRNLECTTEWAAKQYEAKVLVAVKKTAEAAIKSGDFTAVSHIYVY